MNEEELKLLEKIETLPKELNMEIRGLILADVCLREENQQLKGELEMAKNNQKQASDSCRQHRLASKNHIRRLERREKQILRLKEQLEASENARKEAIKYCNEVIKNVESLDLKIYPREFYELINILDIDKGE